MAALNRRSPRRPKDELEEFIHLISSSVSLNVKACAVKYIRMQCCLPAAKSLDRLIKGLIRCLNINFANIQRDAAWALTNYACYPHDICVKIVLHGGITALAKCARTTKGETRDMAIWAIGNVAADCNFCRREVCWSSALPTLLNIMNEDDFIYQQCAPNLLWSLSEIFRGGAPFLEPEVLFAILACLYDLLGTDNEVFKTYAALCVSYIAHDRFDGSQIDVLLSVHGLMERMVELFDEKVTSTSALTTIGHVVAGTDQQAQRALDLGVLPRLVRLFNTSTLNPRRKRVIGWILSNVAAGTQSQIDLLFTTEGTIEMLHKLSLAEERLVRWEACWTASNAFLRASERRIVQLCLPVLPILFLALDEVKEGALCENILRAIDELIQKRANFVYLVHFIGLIDRIFPILTTPPDAEIEMVASAILSSHKAMLARQFPSHTFYFLD